MTDLIAGRNDNPSASEFKARYKKLLVCNEIVYKNDKGNCISNDTGILTVSTRAIPQPSKESTDQGDTFEIELDYFQAVEEDIPKFDQHLYANVASTIETTLIAKMKRYKKQECVQCIGVFEDNRKFQDEFLKLQAATKPCREFARLLYTLYT